MTPYLTALGAHVRGVARHAGVRSGVEVLAGDKLPELLPETDALVMILPGSESTRDALNAERLKLLPKHAWVVNVGRGISINEDALVDALENGEIGGAALDDFQPIPLTAASLYYLVVSNQIECPTISEAEIWDKSKADTFAKGAALVQSMWLIVQCTARASQGLTVTPL